LNLTDKELGAYPLSKLVNREKYVMHLKQVTGYANVSKVTEITVSNQLMVSEITVSESAEESLSESTPRKGLFLIEVSVVLICIFALGGFVYARRKKTRHMQMNKDKDIARAREICMMHEDIMTNQCLERNIRPKIMRNLRSNQFTLALERCLR